MSSNKIKIVTNSLSNLKMKIKMKKSQWKVMIKLKAQKKIGIHLWRIALKRKALEMVCRINLLEKSKRMRMIFNLKTRKQKNKNPLKIVIRTLKKWRKMPKDWTKRKKSQPNLKKMKLHNQREKVLQINLMKCQNQQK